MGIKSATVHLIAAPSLRLDAVHREAAGGGTQGADETPAGGGAVAAAGEVRNVTIAVSGQG